MFVKIYEYHIKKDMEQCFLEIQEKVARIYNEHIKCEVAYLKSTEDETLWLEIAKYSSEEEYLSKIQNVNNEPAIKELYDQFESCLVPGKQIITERNFIMQLSTLPN